MPKLVFTKCGIAIKEYRELVYAIEIKRDSGEISDISQHSTLEYACYLHSIQSEWTFWATVQSNQFWQVFKSKF